MGAFFSKEAFENCVSEYPDDFIPAGASVVVGFDPATGDSVTGFYDPTTGVTHIQRMDVKLKTEHQ